MESTQTKPMDLNEQLKLSEHIHSLLDFATRKKLSEKATSVIRKTGEKLLASGEYNELTFSDALGVIRGDIYENNELLEEVHARAAGTPNWAEETLRFIEAFWQTP